MEQIKGIINEYSRRNPQPPALSVVNLMVRDLVMLVRMCAFDVANLDTTLITATSQGL
ncbi:hypothetical protein PIB30_113714 [Stylosanthes scabra]|uniref:Uncharacterized protein n=1 Tax=Stylosanthes scabra TaxID=79078 RepID=A0ABU6U312_9FABA|nr:hypothetical protein [Stylosanthes scabra]